MSRFQRPTTRLQIKIAEFLSGPMASLDLQTLGALVRLMIYSSTTVDGNFPDDDHCFSTIFHANSKVVRRVMTFIRPLLEPDPDHVGFLYIPSLIHDREEYERVCEQRKDAAALRWQSKSNTNAYPQAYPPAYPPALQKQSKSNAKAMPSLVYSSPNINTINAACAPASDDAGDAAKKMVSKKETKNDQKKEADFRSSKISIEDLQNPNRLEELYRLSISKGWIAASPANKINFFAAAAHAIRIGNDPPALFASIIHTSNWKVISDDDEEQARNMLKPIQQRIGSNNNVGSILSNIVETAKKAVEKPLDNGKS